MRNWGVLSEMRAWCGFEKKGQGEWVGYSTHSFSKIFRYSYLKTTPTLFLVKVLFIGQKPVPILFYVSFLNGMREKTYINRKNFSLINLPILYVFVYSAQLNAIGSTKTKVYLSRTVYRYHIK